MAGCHPFLGMDIIKISQEQYNTMTGPIQNLQLISLFFMNVRSIHLFAKFSIFKVC